MRRAHAWPIGIALVLLTTVVANLWVMRVASDDPSFAIEPDYYAKAVQWDSTMAQDARNRQLGWSIVPAIGAFDVRDGARLDVRVVDASGADIRDAVVHVSAFAIARSNTRVNVELARTSSGYGARVPLSYGGEWELRFDVRRGSEHLTAIKRVDATAGRFTRRRGA